MGTHTSSTSDEFPKSRGEAVYSGMEQHTGVADERHRAGNGTQGFFLGDTPGGGGIRGFSMSTFEGLFYSINSHVHRQCTFT